MTARTIHIDERLPERVRTIMEFLLKAAIEAIGADGSSVMLLSPGGDILTMVGMAAREAGVASNIGISVRKGERVCGRVAQTGNTAIINGDVQQNPDFSGVKKYQEIKSGISSPLRANGRVLGVLNLKRIAMDAPLNPTEARIAEALASVAAGLLRECGLS